MLNGKKCDMNWLDNFNNIKVEITSHCNAKCPGCTRNITGGKNISNLDLNHMPLELWQRIMHEDTKGMLLNEILFDGNVGDLCMHPDAIDFVKTTVDAHPECSVHINTNGGARNEKFWAELGSALSGKAHRVNFAIDGLEDTHHIHRRSTTYDIIQRNAKAFIDAGGQANWIFTLFDHNLHQYAEAEKRAIELDYAWFQIRHSCIPGEDLFVKTDTEEYEIGTEHIYEHDEKLISLKDVVACKDAEWRSGTNSQCSAFAEKQIQIDFRGILWPCSYIYATETFNDKPLSMSPFHKHIDLDRHDGPIVPHPGNTISLYSHSLSDILNNSFYTDTLVNAIKTQEWKVCNLWCLGNTIHQEKS